MGPTPGASKVPSRIASAFLSKSLRASADALVSGLAAAAFASLSFFFRGFFFGLAGLRAESGGRLLFERNAESFQAVGDGGAQVGDGLEGFGAGSQAGVNAFSGEELRFEVRLRHVDARIEGDGERLLHHRAVADEEDFVLAGNGERAETLFARGIGGERVIGDGVLDVIEQAAVVAEIQSLRRIVTQIPDETIEPGIFREMRGGAEPIIRNVFRRGIHGRDKAVETADDFSLRVVDFERERIAGNGFQVVINDGAVGRIFRGGFFGGSGVSWSLS